MSDDSIDNIEIIETPIEHEETETHVEPKESETPEAKETEALEAEPPEETGDKELSELPLPGDEEQENKKAIPKWVDKKLSKKDQEILQAQNEAALYRAQIEQLKVAPAQQNQQWADPEMPKREAFADESQFISAVVAHTNKRDAQVAQQQAQQQGMINAEKSFSNKWKEAADLGSQKYEDFDEKVSVLNSPGFPSNRAMAEAIIDTEYKHDILYFLASHPEKAKEIALLNPVKAVKEIAAIEARFEARKKSKASKAPAPIESIKTNQVKGFTVNSFEELAKNSANMSQAEYEKAVREMNAKSEKWGV